MRRALIQKRHFGGIELFATDIEDLEPHDLCIIMTDRGQDYGTFVKYCDSCCSNAGKDESIPRIERRVNQQDKRKIEQNLIEEKKGFEICQKKIKEMKKEMKLVAVEYTFDKTKMIFYFTAKGRVDFRDLVKDLANMFKTRIELHQIGVRDESRIIGGIGTCGRVLCCNSWIQEFEPVNIKMAKSQRLSLNPEKISGLCGRLLCCLRYEFFTYKFYEGKIPLEGTYVKYRDDVGQIESVNVLKQTLVVRFDDGRKIEINGSEAKVVEKNNKPEDREKEKKRDSRQKEELTENE
jgi:cell fate regulator YaaT (PSP1 superfamily)